MSTDRACPPTTPWSESCSCFLLAPFNSHLRLFFFFSPHSQCGPCGLGRHWALEALKELEQPDLSWACLCPSLSQALGVDRNEAIYLWFRGTSSWGDWQCNATMKAFLLGDEMVFCAILFLSAFFYILYFALSLFFPPGLLNIFFIKYQGSLEQILQTFGASCASNVLLGWGYRSLQFSVIFFSFPAIYPAVFPLFLKKILNFFLYFFPLVVDTSTPLSMTALPCQQQVGVTISNKSCIFWG